MRWIFFSENHGDRIKLHFFINPWVQNQINSLVIIVVINLSTNIQFFLPLLDKFLIKKNLFETLSPSFFSYFLLSKILDFFQPVLNSFNLPKFFHSRQVKLIQKRDLF